MVKLIFGCVNVNFGPFCLKSTLLRKQQYFVICACLMSLGGGGLATHGEEALGSIPILAATG